MRGEREAKRERNLSYIENSTLVRTEMDSDDISRRVQFRTRRHGALGMFSRKTEREGERKTKRENERGGREREK